MCTVEAKNPGTGFATASMDEYPVRDIWAILDTTTRRPLRKTASTLMSDIVMLTVRGTTPARSRHKGTNRFHPFPIDAQLLGLEVMALHQYRQTRVKEATGRGSGWEMNMAHSAMTSEGRRFTGRRRFLKEITSCRTPLARFPRESTYETFRQNPRISLQFTGPYFSCERGHRSRRDRRQCRPYPRAFHKKLFA